MHTFRFTPRGVCTRAIEITLEGDIIREVRFQGGCAGNTQGVAALVRGMTAKEAIARLSGIRCGFKQTSCPDQLAIALTEALKVAKEA
ncbi:MAG: TIGR03905 family TSCPD domain-containing protein [Clostridia bacterium]|nr:TIGR03905 family TSCPD domain-containing protein [Clostridia bacterium]